jgi:hypothetical protein
VNKKIITLSAVIILIETVLHFLGVFGLWYVKYWWLDLLTHFIGGFWLSLTAIWLLFFSGYLNFSRGFYKIFLSGILSVFIIAVIWEFFEYSLDLRYSPDGYWFDTRLDIIIGTCGGIISSFVTAVLWKKNLN